jgi:hypothetical protein
MRKNNLDEKYFVKMYLEFDNCPKAYEIDVPIKKEDYEVLKQQIESSDKVRAIEVKGELELKLSEPISN